MRPKNIFIFHDSNHLLTSWLACVTHNISIIKSVHDFHHTLICFLVLILIRHPQFTQIFFSIRSCMTQKSRMIAVTSVHQSFLETNPKAFLHEICHIVRIHNEWQKTEPVPIPLFRPSRNFPNLKTRNVSCFDMGEVPRSPGKWNWNRLSFLPFIFSFE